MDFESISLAARTQCHVFGDPRYAKPRLANLQDAPGSPNFSLRLANKTVWPSGLRRWLQAPVRKGVGSNPTAVTFTPPPRFKTWDWQCKDARSNPSHGKRGEQAEIGKNESGVAQWLACWAHNPKVRGSKPRSAMFCYMLGVAPLVMRRKSKTRRKNERCSTIAYGHTGD